MSVVRKIKNATSKVGAGLGLNTRAHRVAETRTIADRARHYGASPKDAVQIGRHHQQEVAKASTSDLRRNLEQAIPVTNKWQMPGKAIRHEAEARELTRRGVGIPAKYSGTKTKAEKIASEAR
ncbi:MAG: hypothetical protein FWE95_07285 [Planctomycetaceae bacterium]|nr:hypothetical protein [Planctomycetaceae bacterium]